ncbi:MAG: hypothetical protein RR145_01440, partial [Oscillospiraceae bacterium]
MKNKKVLSGFIALVLCLTILPINAVELKEENSYNVDKTVFTEDFSSYTAGIPNGFKAKNANLSAKDGGVCIPKGCNLKKTFEKDISNIAIIEADIK